MFCVLNGHHLHVPTEEAVTTMLAVAVGDLDEAGLSQWLANGTPTSSSGVGGNASGNEQSVRRRDRNGHVLGGHTNPTKEARHRHPWRSRYLRTRHGTV
jgi:hypothetical protein